MREHAVRSRPALSSGHRMLAHGGSEVPSSINYLCTGNTVQRICVSQYWPISLSSCSAVSFILFVATPLPKICNRVALNEKYPDQTYVAVRVVRRAVVGPERQWSV